MAAFPTPDARVGPADHQLVLRAAVSAYLGRYRGETRLHAESDLRVFLRWCTDRSLDALAAVRADIEGYVRWLQDVRRYQPSTVSRRLSIVVGFCRVCRDPRAGRRADGSILTRVSSRSGLPTGCRSDLDLTT